MRCEKCSAEIEKTMTCGRCGETVLELGPFCYLCGQGLRNPVDRAERQTSSTAEDASDDIDFSTRLLCSDGACIGVINEQGVCKVCGKPYVPES